MSDAEGSGSDNDSVVSFKAKTMATYRHPPKIAEFSGESGKYSAFELFKFDVECLLGEGIEENIIKGAIRRCVRGPAQRALLILGPEASVADILAKFCTSFGPTLAPGTVLANLYTMSQRHGEDAGAFAARLEDTVQQAIELGRAERAEADRMLKEAFNGGLSNDTKMATSYILADNALPFDKLVLEVKRKERELGLRCASLGASSNPSPVPAPSRPVAQANAITPRDPAIDGLMEMMKALTTQVETLGRQVGGQSSVAQPEFQTPRQSQTFARGRGFPSRGRGYQSRGGGQSGPRLCFSCNSPGHIARECDQRGHLNWQGPPRRGGP